AAGGNFSTSPIIELTDRFDDHRAAAYAALDINPTRTTTVTPGVRVDHFDRISETTVLPRLSVQQNIGQDWAVRLALGVYSRAPDQGEALQTTLDPELAVQYVAGADYDIADG